MSHLDPTHRLQQAQYSQYGPGSGRPRLNISRSQAVVYIQWPVEMYVWSPNPISIGLTWRVGLLCHTHNWVGFLPRKKKKNWVGMGLQRARWVTPCSKSFVCLVSMIGGPGLTFRCEKQDWWNWANGPEFLPSCSKSSHKYQVLEPLDKIISMRF